MNGNRLVFKGRLNEARHDHTVLAGLARADRVEQPDDHYRQAGFLPVCKSEKFIERLGAGVGPAMLIGGAGKEIVLFAKGNRSAFAVNF